MIVNKCTNFIIGAGVVLFTLSATQASPPNGYIIVHQYTLAHPPGVNQFTTLDYDGVSVTGYGFTSPAFDTRAVYWSTPTSQAVNLNPTGYSESFGNAVGGMQVGGYGITANTPSETHALIWNGSAQSFVDLNPQGFNYSRLLGVGNGWQVGTVSNSNGHAYLWHGTLASAVDLNPPGATHSQAIATDGVQQVGSAFFTQDHAILWTGTAASMIDLNPAGYPLSYAHGLGGNQQVGIAYFQSAGDYHAMVWSGTAASAVDLNPAGWIHSDAVSTNGIQQVGSAKVLATSGLTHAAVWSGTSASFVDLGAFFPNDTDSKATYIDSAGHIFGLAGNGVTKWAVEWAPVPEPSAMALLIVTYIATGIRRRRASIATFP